MKIFNSELKLTEQEEQFEVIVKKMLEAEDTKKFLKVASSDVICILKNEGKHFTIMVDCVGITIQNTTFSTRHRLRDKVTTHFKDLIVSKINEEVDNLILEMSQKEFNLLNNINKLL